MDGRPAAASAPKSMRPFRHQTSMIRIGTAGWSIPKSYVDEFPQDGSHLSRYSKILSCAEINSSFYRSHRISTWAKWADSVPDDFRFSVKAPKTITHDAKLACSAEQLTRFLSEARTLATKLGPILFQLSPKCPFSFGTAEAFFTMLRDLYPGSVVIEPRHSTWFTVAADRLLQLFQIARVAADPAIVPQAATPGGWSQVVYYRLHGSPRMYYSAYERSFLELLASNISGLHSTSEVWCIFDNTASGAALGDTQILKQLIQ